MDLVDVEELLSRMGSVLVIAGVSRTMYLTDTPTQGASLLIVEVTTGDEFELPVDPESAGMIEAYLSEGSEPQPGAAQVDLTPAQASAVETMVNGETGETTDPEDRPRKAAPISQF